MYFYSTTEMQSPLTWKGGSQMDKQHKACYTSMGTREILGTEAKCFLYRHKKCQDLCKYVGEEEKGRGEAHLYFDKSY